MTSSGLRLHTRSAYSTVSSSTHYICAPTNDFVVFNPCVKLDASGITPFLPYIIRGDLIRLLDNGNNGSSALRDVVSLFKPLSQLAVEILVGGKIEFSR